MTDQFDTPKLTILLLGDLENRITKCDGIASLMLAVFNAVEQ